MSRDYQEKRDFMRMNINSPAILTLDDGTQLDVVCADLSSSGLKLISSKPLAIETKADITLASGTGITGDLKAKIVIQRMDEVDEKYCLGAVIEAYL